MAFRCKVLEAINMTKCFVCDREIGVASGKRIYKKFNGITYYYHKACADSLVEPILESKFQEVIRN